jgi:hypothetical protein
MLARPEIEYLTWVFLDHGTVGGLNIDGHRMSIQDFKSMFHPKLKGIANKSVFVILDSCGSTEFAGEAIGEDLGPGRMCALTAASAGCMTSLVIVSADDAFVHCKDLGNTKMVRYRIQSSMMMRRFLSLIAYNNCDPLLSELYKVLNHPCVTNAGFQAMSTAKLEGEEGCSLRLRDFFGPPLAEGAKPAAKLVIPAIPEASPIFDDPTVGGLTPGAICVRLGRDEESPVILGYGWLEADENEGLVLTDVGDHSRADRQEGIATPATPSLSRIVEEALKDVVVRALPEAVWPKNGGELVIDLCRAMMEITECYREEIAVLYKLVPSFAGLDASQRNEVLLRALQRAKEAS